MKPLRAADQGGTVDLPFNGRVLARLLAVLDDRTSTAPELARLVLCDPALSLHIVVSASPFAGGEATQSMEACIGLLGRDMLHALVFLQAGKRLTNSAPAHPRPILDRLWARSILCAEVAGSLARNSDQPDAPAQLAGLLHQLGKLVLLQSRGDAYARLLASFPRDVDILNAEREAFQTTNHVVGATWVQASGLPGFFADGLQLMHEPLDRLSDAPYLVRAVRAGSALAEQGLTEDTRRIAGELLGLNGANLVRLFEDAVVTARRNPAGIPISDASSSGVPETGALAVEGDLTFPEALPGPGLGALQPVGLAPALARAATHQVISQAMLDSGTREQTLEKVRRLTRLLTGIAQQFFFFDSPEGGRLSGFATTGDPAGLKELSVALEGSSSALAQAACERRAVRVRGRALEAGAAIDRVIARMMQTTGIMCLPMTHGPGLLGVMVVALPPEWQEQEDDDVLLQWMAAAASAMLVRLEQRAGNVERVRNELTERFRSAGKRVVHEAGNPLAIVKNYLKLLSDKLGDLGQFREELVILNEELDRVTGIIRRMEDPLALDTHEPARLDLNSMVHELMTLSKDTLFVKRGIEIVQQLDPQLPLLQADVGAVKQVALNVLTNAAEAMPNGGRLGVMTADNVNFGGDLFVLLQVSDSGGGVPPEVLGRMFKASTTTKGKGHEGIGLAVSASILQRLGGRILCRSSLGRGTIFLILLPRLLYGADAGASADTAT
jgi:signal transduction histidine kinase